MDIESKRKQAGMTQAALARASGVSVVSISRYESGERIPTLDVAARIASVLGYSVDDLIHKK